MMVQKFLYVIITVFSLSIEAQNISSQIIDVETNLPIPFATIQFGNYQGVMTNEEGFFKLSVDELKEQKDSLTISCLGYKTLKVASTKSLESVIKLTPDIYEVIPIFLHSKNLTTDEIMENVKENLASNYETGYQKSQLFIRTNFTNNIKKFDFTLKESTLKNINQKLLDDTFKQIPRKSVFLSENLSDAVTKGNGEGLYAPKKMLVIQSKEELASSEKITKEFMKIMEENFKSDSKLILKTGILRLEKTESIDSILKDMKNDIDKEKKTTKQLNNQNTNTLDHKKLFIYKDSEVDVVYKPSKYNFTKSGFALWGDDWVYILNFSPKGNAKYRGTLYIDTENFAVVKAEFYNADLVYENLFNMLGIKANTLTYKNIVLFKKIENKYSLSYYLKENTNEVGIDRPFSVIEKNDATKGKKRINKVEVQMNMQVRGLYKTEYVFDQIEKIDKNKYTNLKPNPEAKIIKLYAYDPNFWNGYKILTPEKAIQELRIEQ